MSRRAPVHILGSSLLLAAAVPVEALVTEGPGILVARHGERRPLPE